MAGSIDDRGRGADRLGRAVILAGGRSRRMGAEKALVTLRGEPLLHRSLRGLARVFEAVTIAAADAAQREALERVVDPASLDIGVDWVTDRTPGCGPLEGLCSALLGIREAEVFVTAVDAPYLWLPLVRRLWGAAAAPGRRAAIPRWRGLLQPACAVYRRELLADLEGALAAGERSVRQLACWNGVVTINLDDAGGREPVVPAAAFANVNTMADLERIGRDIDNGVLPADPLLA